MPRTPTVVRLEVRLEMGRLVEAVCATGVGAHERFRARRRVRLGRVVPEVAVLAEMLAALRALFLCRVKTSQSLRSWSRT
jgi:hypothetical protein